MTAEEAATLVRAMAESLAERPDQFNVVYNVAGQQITSHGGTGLKITVSGGGAGSTTIGQTVHASAGSPQIQQGVREAHNATMTDLVEKLSAFAAELERASPDRSKLHALYEGLLDTWVPGVVTSVLGNLLTSAIR